MNTATKSDTRTAEERCFCGNLVAKIAPGGVEILCRRCKRIHRIPGQRAEQDLPDRVKTHA